MLLSATKSRKKQQTELVQSVIHAEEEKRRKERKQYHITSVPVLSRAAYEPSLYHGASDEHEDSKFTIKIAHQNIQRGIMFAFVILSLNQKHRQGWIL